MMMKCKFAEIVFTKFSFLFNFILYILDLKLFIFHLENSSSGTVWQSKKALINIDTD